MRTEQDILDETRRIKTLAYELGTILGLLNVREEAYNRQLVDLKEELLNFYKGRNNANP